MAGLAVADGSAWQAIRLSTRIAIDGVFVPEREELIGVLRRFGRPKDQARLRLLGVS